MGCSLTATRPIQEMSNAEVAIKAARDLNADSLVPDIFRSANEEYYKAKRDFRLKDFENSKLHALRAMRLAEQAEFEAYRMGGATPEASRNSAPEGAYPDADAAFRENAQPEPQYEPAPPSNHSAPRKEPEEKGIDYNEYVRQKEAEAERQAKEQELEKAKSEKKPGGPTGPKPPSGVPVTGLNAAQTGSASPATSNPLGSDFQPKNLNQDLRPNPGSPKPQIYYEGAEPVPKEVTEMKAPPVPDAGATPMPELGSTPPEEKSGFDGIENEGLPALDGGEIPPMGEYSTPSPHQDEEKQK